MIILNAKVVNTPTKRQRLSGWIKKNNEPTICCLHETHFKQNDIGRLKVKQWETICHPNTNQNKTGVGILIYDNVNL